MSLKIIEDNSFKSMFPYHGSIALEDMEDRDKNYYLLFHSLYRKLFIEYICKKTNFEAYDKQLFLSGLDYVKIEIDDMDIYQDFSSDILSYLYIRNNIYIEKLTKEECAFFANKIASNDHILDKETENIIESTFKKVIFEDALGDGTVCDVFYGPMVDTFKAPNNSLVVGIRYDEFALNGLDEDDWDELNDRQQINLYDLSNEIQKEMSDVLDMPVRVMQYDESSINII